MTPAELIDRATSRELLALPMLRRARRELDLLRLERFTGHRPTKQDRLIIALKIAELMVGIYGLGGRRESHERVHLTSQQNRILDAVIAWWAKFASRPSRAQIAAFTRIGRRAVDRAVGEMVCKGVLYTRPHGREVSLAAVETEQMLRELVERFAQLRTGAGGNNGTRQGSPLPEAKDVRGKDAAAPREGRTRHFHRATERKQRRAA